MYLQNIFANFIDRINRMSVRDYKKNTNLLAH